MLIKGVKIIYIFVSFPTLVWSVKKTSIFEICVACHVVIGVK